MAKSRKSELSGSFGSALKKHAKDETDYGMEIINLPAGITGGVAKLEDAHIGVYKKGRNEGRKFLYLGGVVVEPKTATRTERAFVEGSVKILSSEQVIVEGQRTSCMFPLCDTQKANGEVVTEDTHVKDALNELRKLGGEECTADLGSMDDLETLLSALVSEGIFFRFSTSSSDPTSQYPTERVWENWHGTKGLEDYVVEDEDDVVEEVTDEEEEPEDEEEDEPDDEEESEDEDNLAELGEIADGPEGLDDTEEAQVRLTELAEVAGVDPDEYPSWAEVAAILVEEEEDEDEEEEEEGEEVIHPKKGELYFFRPKGRRKLLECEVIAVYAGKETCNLKSLNDQMVYKSVPWTALVKEAAE